MKAIVGTAPNLPWWRLCSMSDVEIEKFNRSHMVEIEMNKPKAIIDYCPRCDEMYLSDLPHDCEMTSKPVALALSDEASKVVWNAAIEAAADEMPISDEGFELNARIRKLKK